jgi:hypothetical protein
MKAEAVLISWLDDSLSRQTPNLSRGSMIDVTDAGIESSHTSETGSEGNLTHRQAGFVDEFFRKVKTASLSHCNRRRSQMSQEQAAEMA